MTEQITNETMGEVASVGELGTSLRGSRLYHNAMIYYDRIDSAEDVFCDMKQQLSGGVAGDISRVVFRGIVSPRTIQALAGNPLARHLEVAQPLGEYGEPGWLIYLAANSLHRAPIKPPTQMIEATAQYNPPADFNPRILPGGFRHINHIPSSSIGQLHDLWEVFDWELDGVRQRAQRIQENLALPPNQRDTWFSGLLHQDALVCAATAERLTYQGANGPFDIVESTEWRTHPDYMQHGLMGHNLWRLNNEILEDLHTGNSKIPLIFAECNFMTRADKAGRRAGFRIPSRSYAGQIIVQNVAVNDGHEPVGLRDFTFLSLPASHGTGR